MHSHAPPPPILWFSIRGLPRPEKIVKLNTRFIRSKTRVQRERAVTWWKLAAQTRPVLDSSSFVPVPTLKLQNTLLLYVQEREREYSVNVQGSVE
jgi:hypothetical protein